MKTRSVEMKFSSYTSISILLWALIALSGCAITPSTHLRSITKSGDTLYIFTADGMVKRFKADSFDLIDRMKFPDMKYSSSNVSPYVEMVISNKHDLLIEAYQSNIMPRDINAYSVKDDKLIKQASLANSRITSSDGAYFYGVETLFNNVNGKIVLNRKSVKYDKTFKRINEDMAIIDGVNYFIKDTFDDNNFTWYICLRGDSQLSTSAMTGEIILSGSFVIVVRDNSTGLFTKYDLPGSYSYVSDEIDTIWFFGLNDRGIMNIAEFSKTTRWHNTRTLNIQIVPFQHQQFSKSSAYLWGYSFKDRKIYRINKPDMTYISLETPREVYVDTFSVPMYSDDNNIWIGATKHRNVPPGMNEVPYIINIQKDNLKIQAFLLNPSIGEAIGTVFESFYHWLLLPVYMMGPG
jgi:hypothetical protein